MDFNRLGAGIDSLSRFSRAQSARGAPEFSEFRTDFREEIGADTGVP
jgi:hypothetical protein